MIYLPKRAVFIHIPRTGGNSIKNAIASTCVGHGVPSLISTVPMFVKEFERCQGHQTAAVLKGYIRDWNDIYRFAIHRPIKDRFVSMNNWVQRLKSNQHKILEPIADEIKDFLEIEDHMKFFEDNWMEHTTQFFTQGHYGEDLGVEVYKFEDLPDRWHEICDKCQIPRCELPHLNKGS